MKAYLIRISIFLFAFLLINQSILAQEKKSATCSTILLPIVSDTKYRAAIDVLNKHLSGILIFKTQEDSSVRAVFINEIGTTFFDIGFSNSSYTIYSIMESMNKKAVKRTLAKDLGMILIRGIYKNLKNESEDSSHIELKLKAKGKVKYHPDISCSKFPLIENYGRRKKVVSITQKYLENQSMPDSIFVQHHTVHFTISLKQMHVTE